MAVLGFDLSSLRDALGQLQTSVRQGVQQAQPASGQPDYLGYLGSVGAPSGMQGPAMQALAHPAPQSVSGLLGGGSAYDTLAQMAQVGTYLPQAALGSLYQQASSVPSSLSSTWDSLTAFASQQAQDAAQKAAAVTASQPATIGRTVGPSAGYTGTGTASDNAGLTGQKIDQFIASKFANSPLVGKGQQILDIANTLGISAPELVGIFWKESGMATTAGPTWNIAGVGGAGGFHQYGSLDAAIQDAASNLASDLYRGKSVQDHIGYWFVGPQRYAQSGLNADDGTGGRNGTVGDYLSNFIAPTYAALGAQFNQAGVPTRQAPAANAGGVLGAAASLVGTPYVLGGLRAHPNNPEQGLDCSEFTAWAYGRQGVTLPPNAQAQFNTTARVDFNAMQPGDLVFFQGTDPSDPDPITHVGIFVGNVNGKPTMLNAQDNGVQYADLSSAYWQGHYAGSGRVGGATAPAPTGGGGAQYR